MYQQLFSPLLRHLDPERAHLLSLNALAAVYRLPGGPELLQRLFPPVDDPRLRTSVFGLDFRTPIGLAAGYDKTGAAAGALACLGFGSVEVGTVTPQPQAGRDKPRVFRLTEDEGLINRLGFPNLGAEVSHKLLESQERHGSVRGINIGPNADRVEVEMAATDCVACFTTLYDVADYWTINISSPNTPGLRALQAREQLQRLLTTFFQSVGERGGTKPVLLKLSPDMTNAELADIVDVVTQHPVAGFIATNTTIQRPETLRGFARGETGGLSGRPLRSRSVEMLRALYRLVGGRLPIVGVGGVFNVEDVVQNLRAGASLVQLYTGMVYKGPGLARTLNLGLVELMEREGLRSVEELVGTA